MAWPDEHRSKGPATREYEYWLQIRVLGLGVVQGTQNSLVQLHGVLFLTTAVYTLLLARLGFALDLPPLQVFMPQCMVRSAGSELLGVA